MRAIAFAVLLLLISLATGDAQFNGCSAGFCGAFPPAPPPATTWDPTHTGPHVSITGGNLTAAFGSQGTGYEGTRSTVSHASGKYYSEVTISNPTALGGDNLQVGILNSTASQTNYLGNDANGAGSFGATAEVFINAASAGNIAAYAANGTVLSVAFDAVNNEIWIAVNGGNWNNNGTANPATNTGGISTAAITGPYFFGTYINTNSSMSPPYTMTANFGAISYAHTPPAGFGNW